MKHKSLRKRAFSVVASMSIVGGLLVATNTSSVNAATGPFYPWAELTVSTDSSDGTFDILDGQTIEVTVSSSLNSAWAGWTSNPTQFSMSAFSLGSLPADVDVDSTQYYWDAGVDGGAPGSCSQTANSSIATVTFTLTGSCFADMTRVYGQIEWTITNNSGADQTINTNTESAHIAVGGSAATGDMTGLYAVATAELDSTGIEIPSNSNGNVYLTWGMQSGQICVESSVAPNSDLDIQRNVALNGVPLTSDMSQAEYYRDSYGSGSTLTVSMPGMLVQRRIEVNTEPSSIGATLTASLDLTLAGVSKLSDSCGGGGGGGGGSTLTQPVIASGAGSLTNGRSAGKGKWSTVKNLPAGFPAPSETHASTAGPLGDMFYYGPDSNGDAVISRLKKTGATKIGGTTTKLTIDLASGETINNFGWYGTAKDKYLLITRISGPSGGYKVYVGNLANANGRSSKTVAQSQVVATNGLCGADSAMYSTLRVLSAPTSTPTVFAFCALAMGRQAIGVGRLIIGAGAAATISRFDTFKPTNALPCIYTSFGVNESASGNKRALVIYSAAGTGGEGMCSGTGVSSRKLITVTTAGVPTSKTISSAVFGSTEPGDLVIAPGKALNSWIVVAVSPDTMMAPGAPTKMYTISATGSVDTKANITLGASQTIFAASSSQVSDYVIPIKELNNGKWMVTRMQFNMMGDTKSIALATVNPQSGAFTYGEGIKFTNYQRNAGAYIDNHSIAPNGEMSYYFSNATGKFKVATWKSFTS